MGHLQLEDGWILLAREENQRYGQLALSVLIYLAWGVGLSPPEARHAQRPVSPQRIASIGLSLMARNAG
jgi:hypothetical protein